LPARATETPTGADGIDEISSSGMFDDDDDAHVADGLTAETPAAAAEDARDGAADAEHDAIVAAEEVVASNGPAHPPATSDQGVDASAESASAAKE
ncbi:MAG: hypothetical protein K2I40_05260, partial [Bifidobacterium castoris]|nr:hypothetical protein [Bifidobacterium castoris]